MVVGLETDAYAGSEELDEEEQVVEEARIILGLNVHRVRKSIGPGHERGLGFQLQRVEIRVELSVNVVVEQRRPGSRLGERAEDRARQVWGLDDKLEADGSLWKRVRLRGGGGGGGGGRSRGRGGRNSRRENHQ
jgi:hypothetical protein